MLEKRKQNSESETCHEDDDGEEYVPKKVRKAIMQQKLIAKVKEFDDTRNAFDAEQRRKAEELEVAAKEMSKKTLLATSHKLRAEAEKNSKNAREQELLDLKKREDSILEEVQKSFSTPLMSVRERAKGIVYTQRLVTNWKILEKYKNMSETEKKRNKRKIFY